MKPMSFDFNSRRSMVLGRRGMVAASNPLASQAGLHILRQGGNAADAAIAAAAVMNVTAPASTGIGGDCFALYYDAKTHQVTALNGSGRAPAALTINYLRQNTDITGDRIPLHNAHAATVPGAVMGWHDLLAKHGTMSLKDVLVDAIYYAREGYAVSPIFGAAWQRSENLLQSSPHTWDYLPVPRVGEVKALPGLAKTLQAIADGGPEAFYKGETAQAIVKTLAEYGGTMTLEDLAVHQSTWDEPIAIDYGGVTIIECPPNGQGLAALQALNIASKLELEKYPLGSPERIHLMVEAMRLAFADANQYIADPAHTTIPLDFLLSDAYADQRRRNIDLYKAMETPSFGKPIDGSDTIYLCTTDSEGNACSFINSLYLGWGTGIVAQDTGVFLQNRGAGFSLDPEHPNALAPNKRPFHTIIPGMAVKDNSLWAAFGVMGGVMQPQGHFQVISSMIDNELNPQEALDQPRWRITEGQPDGVIDLEEGIDVKTMARLAELGHTVKPISGAGRAIFGSGQIIRHEDGVYFGGSDPRKDGSVAAY